MAIVVIWTLHRKKYYNTYDRLNLPAHDACFDCIMAPQHAAALGAGATCKLFGC